MTGTAMLGMRNHQAKPLAEVPDVTPSRFRDTVVESVWRGWRLVSFFGVPEGVAHTRLLAVLADDTRGTLAAVSSRVLDRYDALSPDCPSALRFEREIAEQCGVQPDGHPALKPLRRHAPDHGPAGHAAPPASGYVFDRLAGEEVHEMAVGPVHAGIIEPGHFRFQMHGERVLGLEVMLGYQHRGVERLLEHSGPARAVLVAESIAGDTVVGHASAYSGALEALAQCRTTPRAQAIRAIALELERLANHLGDLGAIAGDIAYQPAASYFGRLRGDCLNSLLALSGNRYGRGLVRPGGVAFDLTPSLADPMRERLTSVARDVASVGAMMLGNASVQARLEGVGVVSRDACSALGLVGPAARACEVARDVRHDHPWGMFRFAHIPVATAWAGDVLARVLVRWLEVQRSMEFVIEQLGALPRSEPRVAPDPPGPGAFVVTMIEGWRGEIVHAVLTDDAGRIRRHKVTDPSFHNWAALPVALAGQQISDFPLCNKSFNLSYAGHDL